MATESTPQHLDGSISSKLPEGIKAFDKIYYRNKKHYVGRGFLVLLGFFIMFLFLPWTQNIRSKGYVTTLYQGDRPQELVSQIPGKIMKWYVKEGDMVNAGDTILLLGEVKDEYLDPNIIPKTDLQIQQNEDKAKFYTGKIGTTQEQITNLENQRELKMSALNNKRTQIERKIQAKEAEIQAQKVIVEQTTAQFERAKIMYDQEAISKFEYERRNGTNQIAIANFTELQNDLANLKQDLIINRLDIENTIQEYSEKVAKAQGDVFSSSSEVAAAREKIADLSIKRENLESRAQYYYVVAPQKGQVIQAKKAGIGEIIKQGDVIVQIVPQDVELAVEIFVDPFDLPLMTIGQKARFIFDGFPALVFSGWPQASIGTFGGKVIAVETNRTTSGKFRVLLVQDPDDRKWPPLLRIGAGTLSFALLKDVPVWFEIWRNLNGFPPEFYKPDVPDDKDKDSMFN